jgi:hypothetical protein
MAWRVFSVVIPLLGRKKFVDRRKNSIDPPSNEFRIQPVDFREYFLPRSGLSRAEIAIFAVFRPPA